MGQQNHRVSLQASLDRYQLESFRAVAKDGHGWVLARPDGTKAPCGGPKVCRECKLEDMVYNTTSRLVVMEGFNLKPGDKLLLIAPPDAPMLNLYDNLKEMLCQRFPEVDITIVAGFTGVQIHRQEPQV